MPEQLTIDDRSFETTLPLERERIVRLCASLTGSPESAEDLAQETMIEAWRSRHKLVDPAGSSRWLSVVARNVCLRWMRKQGHEARLNLADLEAPEDLDRIPAPTPDLEIELERDELANLLDRALAQLPTETRAALVYRYVLELPQAEAAARLGLTEGAVEARLQRGKVTLHRLLRTDLQAEDAALGRLDGQRSAWQQTRIWCPICGRHKLHGTLPGSGQDFELHCPNCSWDPKAFLAQSTNMPQFAGLKSYRPILKRFVNYMGAYLGAGLTQRQVNCQQCGRPVPLRFELPPSALNYPGYSRRGVSVACPFCGSSSYGDIYGLALDAPVAQKFWQCQPRMRVLPEQELDYGSRPALLIRLESLSQQAALDMVLDRETYILLAAHPSGVSL